MRVADLLSNGPGKAVPLRSLEELTGLSSREVRRQIERERRAGALIVSDNRHGYWLAAGPEEAQRFARSMLARAGEIRRTARAVEVAAKKVGESPSVGTPDGGEESM